MTPHESERVQVELEFIGPGCWMWTVTTRDGQYGGGISANRTNAAEDATAAVRRYEEER